MEKLLVSKYSRRLFYSFSLLILLILLVARLFFIPVITLSEDYISILNTIIDATFSTVFSTILIASLIFWLTPRIVQNSHVEIIEPNDIGDMLKKARITDDYWFSGSTARFTRSTTIPELAREARRSNFSKRIKIQMLSPENIDTLEAYIEYKNRVRRGKKDPWTVERARQELFATILSAYSWMADEPLLEVEIGLKDNVSFFRIDLSKQLAVITKEDPKEPALLFISGTFFYNSYLEELRFSLKHAKRLDINIPGVPHSELHSNNVRSFFEKLGFNMKDFSDDEMRVIIELAKESKNPYD